MSTVTAFGRIFTPRPDWLAKAEPEAIIDSGRPIIDTHHHLWHRDGDNRYFLTDYLADCATGHNIVGSVFLQCHAMYKSTGPEQLRPTGETEFVAGIAAQSDSGQYGSTKVAAGIVGFADLTAGDWVRPVLEAHIRAAGGRFRGVRHSAAYDADPIIGNGADVPHLYNDTKFRAGMKQLESLGLSLDAWTFHTQLDEITALAQAFPSANIITGHCGGLLGYGPYAGKKDEVFSNWKRSVTKLSKCQNVTMKLGGMTMRLAAYDYLGLDAPPTSQHLADHWRPYVETCVDLFGADRCIAESNFPVEKMGVTFAALFNALKRITAGCSEPEKSAIFADTARRVYRLDC